MANTYAQQQVPEGNFENWTGGEPAPWHNSVFGMSTATQSSDSYQGEYAAELKSQSFFGQFIPGLITLGEVDAINMTLTGGIPYTDRPTGIRFFFKYMPSGVDTMVFAAFFTKWNAATSSVDTIGGTLFLNSKEYDTYTKMELPFIWASEENPDTANIIITSSGLTGNANSTLLIDSIAFFNGVAISPTFCFAATDITGSSFTAHWLAIPGAISYDIDVSESSDFSSFVSGYENLNVQDTFKVINVGQGTYYYRVRVNYTEGTSINSNVVEVHNIDTYISDINSDALLISTNGNLLTLDFKNMPVENLTVYNLEGKKMQSVAHLNGQTCNISMDVPGIYILEYRSKNSLYRKKVPVFF